MLHLIRSFAFLVFLFTVACGPSRDPNQVEPTPKFSSSPVANSGHLKIVQPEPSETIYIQSAIWNGKQLIVTGENFETILVFKALELKGELALESDAKPLPNPNYLVHPKADSTTAQDNYKKYGLTSGALKIVNVTGSGPWELDGEFILQGKDAPLEGLVQMKVDKTTNVESKTP